MKNILIIVILTAMLPASEIYKQVRVYSDTEETLSILQTSGLDMIIPLGSPVSGSNLLYLKVVSIYWMRVSSAMIFSMKIWKVSMRPAWIVTMNPAILI